MEFVKGFRDLEVYKLTRKLSKEIFEISKSFPKEEMYSLTDQVRRSSRSIGGQIAEAWGKRRYEKSFVSKLTDADAEQLETQHWIETALDCSYISIENSKMLLEQSISIGKMLNSMITKAEAFCHHHNP
ncbi:MAG: four helix bundle protein [Saprospiraceae bacterium]